MTCRTCGGVDPFAAPAACLSCALDRLKRYLDPAHPCDARTLRVAAEDARDLSVAFRTWGQPFLAIAAGLLAHTLDSRAIAAANHEAPPTSTGPLN